MKMTGGAGGIKTLSYSLLVVGFSSSPNLGAPSQALRSRIRGLKHRAIEPSWGAQKAQFLKVTETDRRRNPFAVTIGLIASDWHVNSQSHYHMLANVAAHWAIMTATSFPSILLLVLISKHPQATEFRLFVWGTSSQFNSEPLCTHLTIILGVIWFNVQAIYQLLWYLRYTSSPIGPPKVKFTWGPVYWIWGVSYEQNTCQTKLSMLSQG